MTEDKQAPMPEFLKQYYEWVRLGPPKCCHTCAYYNQHGVCNKYKERPPAHFINTAGQCPAWDQDIPF